MDKITRIAINSLIDEYYKKSMGMNDFLETLQNDNLLNESEIIKRSMRIDFHNEWLTGKYKCRRDLYEILSDKYCLSYETVRIYAADVLKNK
jgi:hypothetical protein